MIMSSRGIEPRSLVPQTRALTNMLTRLKDSPVVESNHVLDAMTKVLPIY
jgi:hypothetical protein